LTETAPTSHTDVRPIDRLIRRLSLDVDSTGRSFRGEAGIAALNGNDMVFGGLVVAQAVVAAGRAMADRTVHSLQHSFLRGASADRGIDYQVITLHEGRTFASLRIDARQGDTLIGQSTVGLSTEVDGPERDEDIGEIPPLATSVDRDELRGIVRPDGQPIVFRIDEAQHANSDAAMDLWLRADGEVDVDPVIAQALLAYASDRGVISTAWKPFAATVGEMFGATLTHSIWFHRPTDLSDWHVHSLRSPFMGSGRGMVLGGIWSADGLRVASTAQEGTIRPSRR